jgi:hypothetical protein
VDLAAAQQVRQSPAHFGTAAETGARCAGTVRGVVSNELAGHGHAATSEPPCVRREKARVQVSVASARALRLLLAEPASATLRVAQAAGLCRTGRVRPVRLALARFGQQNQDMPLSTTRCAPAGSASVVTGNRAPVTRRKAAPNWALDPTRSGNHRKPGPRPTGHHRSPGLRRLPTRVGSAQR